MKKEMQKKLKNIAENVWIVALCLSSFGAFVSGVYNVGRIEKAAQEKKLGKSAVAVVSGGYDIKSITGDYNSATLGAKLSEAKDGGTQKNIFQPVFKITP